MRVGHSITVMFEHRSLTFFEFSASQVRHVSEV
jgi:hypothetical protein